MMTLSATSAALSSFASAGGAQATCGRRSILGLGPAGALAGFGLAAFDDDAQPNEAPKRGDVDASAVQHKPCLDDQSKTRGDRIA
jgi:hypothetical protein